MYVYKIQMKNRNDAKKGDISPLSTVNTLS